MKEFETLANGIWEHVCKNIVLILKECDLYGLAGILTIPDPSIENRINALKNLDQICQLIIDNTSAEQYSVSRVMYNAKQQILHLEMLLSAAKNEDAVGFKEAQDRLNGQSTH